MSCYDVIYEFENGAELRLSNVSEERLEIVLFLVSKNLRKENGEVYKITYMEVVK